MPSTSVGQNQPQRPRLHTDLWALGAANWDPALSHRSRHKLRGPLMCVFSPCLQCEAHETQLGGRAVVSSGTPCN